MAELERTRVTLPAAVGCLYELRLYPDGRLHYDTLSGNLKELTGLSDADVNASFASGQFPHIRNLSEDFLPSIYESARQLTPWVRDLNIVNPHTQRELWLRIHGIPRRLEDGSVVWSGLMTDITDLKRSEAQLRQVVEALTLSEAHLKVALDSARMFAWDLDLRTGRWVTTAPLEEFYGVPAEEIDFTSATGSLVAVHPDDVPVVVAGRQRAIETGEPMCYEFRGRVPAADGSTRWFATRGTVIYDDAGRPVRIVAVTSDITERKRAEAEREAFYRQMLEAQKWESLGVLAGGVAHDFNNLLTVILGGAGLTRRAVGASPVVNMYLDQIEQACHRAAELCRQLLAYAGRSQLARTDNDVNAVIQAVVEMLSGHCRAGQQLRMQLAPDLPLIRADPALVRQVIFNLLTNGLEALEGQAGVVTISTERRQIQKGEATKGFVLLPPPGEYVCVCVQDTGIGIPPELHSRVFDPFFSTKFAGRGLGLAAVLGILRSHQGGIRLESQMGQGTLLEIYWPITPREVAKPLQIGEATPLGPPKVLVVDDELYIREVIASTLQEMGYEPLLAAEAEGALTLCRQYLPQIVLAVLDVVMPGMSGDQLLKSLRQLSPALPVIMTSGYTDGRILPSGADRITFLQKPFRPEELMALVRQLLGDQEAA
jgi:PAS domain S-box-containing protein